MRVCFLTGSTGAIGAHLVPLLLEEREAEVRLLIRATDDAHLEKRLAELFAFWGYGSNQEGIRRRIRAVRGDVSLPRLGVPAAEYESLAGECTHIVHCAGNVRMNLTLEEARKSSVDAARNMLTFAGDCRRHGKFKKLEFVSTVGVGGRIGGLVPETWITKERAFHNTYERAKAEAEVDVARHIEEGMPVTVHRPSMVVGDSRTGRIVHFQVFYHLCEFLSGRRTLGVVPGLRDIRLDIIPVDYVARAIAWSSYQESTKGKVLHLCSGPEHAVEICELMEEVQKTFREAGEKLPRSARVPLALFKGLLPLLSLFVSPRAKRALKTLPIFFDYLAERQSFANEKTRAMLEAEGLELPAVKDYLRNVLLYYADHRAALSVDRE